TMTGKGSPKTLRAADIKGTKQKVPEAELGSGFCDDSPAKKMKVSCTKSPPVDGTDGFETAWSDAVGDINLLFNKYLEVL
ncbi:testis-expressed sequence 12 protein isoform X4, partial [Clarias magur]